MKKIYYLLTFVFLIGCNIESAERERINEQKRLDSISDIRAGVTSITGTPVEMPSSRYFLVSYTSQEKRSGSSTISGNTWFSADGFPNKRQIDSMVYVSFPLKRSCYQNVIVTSIFEFKSESDYDSFGNNYKGDKKPKRHIQCSY
jgi:hypothetical protein